MKSQTFVRAADAELVLEHRPYCGCRKGQGLVELGCVRGYLVPAALTGVQAGLAFRARLEREHAGLGLPCDRCVGPCQLDSLMAGLCSDEYQPIHKAKSRPDACGTCGGGRDQL